MARPETELQVLLDVVDAEEEELAELTAQLRAELLHLDVDHVAPVTEGDAPEGTRAGDVVTVGALLVGLAGQANLLPALVDTVKGWLDRLHQPSTVKIEMDGDVLEVTGASSTQQRELIEAWLDRHGRTGASDPPADPAAAAGP